MSISVVNPHTGELQLLSNVVADIDDLATTYLKLDTTNSPLTGSLALGTNSLTLTGSIASTGSRVTKGWFTDLEITNMLTVGGTSIQTTFDSRYAIQASNLSDLDDIGTARTNLGLIAGGAGDIWVEKAGDTMTGNLLISKADPILTLTDTGDSNSLIITRTDTAGEAYFTNVVNQQASANLAITNDGTASIYYELDYAVSAATQASLSVWFQAATVTGDQYIFAPQATGKRNFAILRTGNKIRFALGLSGAFDWAGTGGTVLSINTWYHVLVTYRGTGTPEAHIYLNGVEETLTVTGTIPASIIAVPASDGMNIGTGFNGTGNWNGIIDELAFWDGAFLSINDAVDLYNSGTGLYVAPFTVLPTDSTTIGTNLWGLWHFDEASGNTSYDYSGNYRHAIQPSGQTNYTRVTGKVLLAAGDNTVEFISSQDAATAGHAGITYFGANESETRFLGRTINFYPNGVLAATITADQGFVLEGGIQSGDFISLPLLSKLYLDGYLGDTYITTATVTSLDSIDCYVGGTNFLKMQRIAGTWLFDIKQDVAIPSLKKLFFDGLGNGDTYIQESTANNLKFNAGIYQMFICNGSTGDVDIWRPMRHVDNMFDYYGSGSDSFLCYYVSLTPDSLVMGLSADSRGLTIVDKTNYAFAWNHALQTNPTIFIHSVNQSTTQWISLTHNQTDGVIDCGTGTLNLGGTANVNFAGATRTATTITHDAYVELEVAGVAYKFMLGA